MTSYHRNNDLICHVGFMLLLGGTGLVAMGYSTGWAGRLAGDAMFTLLGIRTRLTGFIVWSIVFMVVDVYGWL